ncbi:MAG: hypothetical protein AB1403_11105 [Candidatus Riflebacteria bacterium]
MNDRNSINAMLPLMRLKLRLLINTFINWKSAGKLLAAVFVMLVSTYSVSAGAADLVFAMQALPFGEFLLEWVLALICLYMIIVVFTGDLLTGHSLNTGQMSSDFGYLISLPVPPLSLIGVKLLERLLTDYIGLLVLLSGIMGVILRQGFELTGFMAGLFIYLQISLLIGLAINLLTITMTRFMRTTSINNFFSLLGYVSAFLTLFPYLLLSSFPGQSLQYLIEFSDSFTSPLFTALEPMRWLSVSLINGGNSTEFLYWSFFWAALMLSGCLCFYLMISWNWLTCSHSASRKRSVPGKRWFSGFLHKEMLLLRSDFNVLINAIFMPVTIIILEIYFFRQAFSFTGSPQVLNMIYAAVIYFCMFGPINAVGAEGKSIAIIESLPISASEFLLRKFAFWLVIAEALFIPATLAGYHFLGFAAFMQIDAMFRVTFFTAVCVWVSVNISAIFVNFEGKILQQRSTLSGKAAALAIMLLAAPIKELDALSSFNLLILVISLIALRQIAIHSLKFRLDHENSATAAHLIMPYLLLILLFIGAETAARQFFRAVIPGYDTGLWSWIIAGMFFIPGALAWGGQILFSSEISGSFKNAVKKTSMLQLISTLIICTGAGVAANGFIRSWPGLFQNLGNDARAMIYGEISAPQLVLMLNSPYYERVSQLFELSRWFTGTLVFLLVLTFFVEIIFRGILLQSRSSRGFWQNFATLVISICANAVFAPRGIIAFAMISGLLSYLLQKKLEWWPACWLFSATLAITSYIALIFI